MNAAACTEPARVLETLTAADRQGRVWQLERVTCLLCGEADCSTLHEWDSPYESVPMRFQVAKCPACGFLFTNPRLSQTALIRYYSERTQYANDDYHQIAEVRPRYENFLEALARHGCNQRRLFEIGCDKGQFLHIAREQGWTVAGIELSAGADIARERYGLPVRRVSLEEAELAPENCDAVVMLDVLEHISQPMHCLRAVSAALAPGGLFLIKVPNVRHEHGLYIRLRGRALGFGAHEHLSHFSQRTLTQALRIAGMEPVEWLGFFPLLGRGIVGRLAAQTVFQANRAISAVWLGWPDYHVSLVCLARKASAAPARSTNGS